MIQFLRGLFRKLFQWRHDYVPNTERFPQLDLEKIASDLRLAEIGAERGAEGKPDSSSTTLDDIENKIITYFEAERNHSHDRTLRDLSVYDDRLDARNCSSRGSSSITVVLIDATDEFSPRQMENIRQGIGGLVRDLKANDELQIFTLRSDGKKLREPDFNQCKPKEVGNQWIENAQQVRDKFETDFKAKLDVALNAAIQSQSAKESPILEALADIGVTAFGPAVAQVPKRLVIVSDLLQYSAGSGVNHYRPPAPTIDQFKKLPNAVSLTPRLEGVRYCVKRIVRPNDRPLQNAAQWQFWEGLFQLSGAVPADCPPVTNAGEPVNSI